MTPPPNDPQRADAPAPTQAQESGQSAQPATGRPDVRFRMRIIQDGTIALGPGKVSLLEAVREHGSISAAARSMNMSYRRAWLLMDELNRALESPAMVSEHGGQSGGGSMLTPVGEEIIRLYRSIETRAATVCAPEIEALVKLVKA
ncbi:winged helix-turn-helix domain-containing protein [Paraburkholderia unamae]|uniref:Molybdate transport system regulatory protein n=1 Tax=Paraburkholderia unamae TaxID=219649 RepID=A0ABX5KN13_9BURK|nr:molybdate transport system regulatory protein [Paraburkholderia unamae]RAR64917.1 molybdate transport system regulatory protein [Paraburkholderia unamae]CAG9265979.1 Molybdate transport system regulatory protein [Paraburkholderia unamae]